MPRRLLQAKPGNPPDRSRRMFFKHFRAARTLPCSPSGGGTPARVVSCEMSTLWVRCAPILRWPLAYFQALYCVYGMTILNEQVTVFMSKSGDGEESMMLKKAIVNLAPCGGCCLPSWSIFDSILVSCPFNYNRSARYSILTME